MRFHRQRVSELPSPTMKIDVSLGGDLATTPDHAAALRAAGIDGGFTFEGNSDVFFPW